MSLKSRSGAQLSVTRDDDVLPGYDPLITVVSANADIIDLAPITAYTLGRLLLDAAGDEGYREHLIASGHLAPGSRSMSLTAAIEQYNAANALAPADPDYLHPPAPVVSLADAVEIIPEAWAIDIAADAQGADVSYTAAANGLRTETIRRIQSIFAARADDPDWEHLSEGQRLDEVFPDYNGIGWPDLLDELGLVTVYHQRDC